MKVVILYNLTERLECGEMGEELAEQSVVDEMKAVKDSLNELGYENREVAIQNEMEIIRIANLLYALDPDVVFNLCESVYGDSSLEMAVPAMLDLMKIRYTGSPSLTLGLCHDKGKAKSILMDHGIQTPSFKIMDWDSHLPAGFSYPGIVKPLHEDGSLGITADSVVKDDVAAAIAVSRILKTYRQPAILEEFIDGREFGVGIIEVNGRPIPFPVSEIEYDNFPSGVPRICSYKAKWGYGSMEYQASVPVCPARIDPSLSKSLQNTGLKIFKTFGCRGYIRVDFRVRYDGAHVIDINPNPDIAPNSGVHNVIRAGGMSYTEFIREMVEGALRGK